ncbi:putative animal haem peroxidase [Trypoxylus dichotomus]
MLLQMYIVVVLLWCSTTQGKQFTDSLLPRPATAFQNSKNCTDNARYLKINNRPPKAHIRLFKDDIDHSLKFMSENVDKMQRLESNLGWSGILIKPGTLLHKQTLVSYPENKAMMKGKQAIITSKATTHLMHKFCRGHNLSKAECAKYMSNIKLTDTSFRHFCADVSRGCSRKEIYSKYRSMDGSCNHPFERSKGQALTSYKRLLFPDYLDGIQEPRRSVQKRHGLPSPRVISSKIIKHVSKPDLTRNMMVAQWTQFVSHDMAHTVSSKMLHSGENIKCCTTTDRKLSPRYTHPFCAPIEIPEDDKFYSKHGIKCMSYVRSVSTIRNSCTLGPLEQLNQATHFLDASNIYGADNKRTHQLRLMENGLLKSNDDYGRMFLPSGDKDRSSLLHFSSGDPRVNTLPGLAVMHTIWLREHNRIAQQLHNLNPNWNDETLFQEARRIVIAEIQHITYHEWLPTILGKEYIAKINFPMDTIRHLDMVEDPSVSNSFATAAMRFEKSLLENALSLYTEDRSLNYSIRTKDYFNKPEIIESLGNLDSLIRGLTTQNSQKSDLDYATDITTQIFGDGVYGYDIVSLDIQRGRDHGLPSYTAFRSLCGLPEVQTFHDLSPDIPKNVASALAKVYRDPHDIDLLIGGMAETPRGDSLLGPTFSCIVSDQFLRTKWGDRYFYEHDEQPKPFNSKQLAEIKRTALARILCDNGDNIRVMQPNAFRPISPSNPLTSCSGNAIPRLNLNYWMES